VPIGRAYSEKPLNANTNVQHMTITPVSFRLHVSTFSRKFDAALMTLDFEEITESFRQIGIGSAFGGHIKY